MFWLSSISQSNDPTQKRRNLHHYSLYMRSYCNSNGVSNKTRHQRRTEYDVYQDYETLETFVDPKDEITVNKIGLWLLVNILMSGCIITFAVILTHV